MKSIHLILKSGCAIAMAALLVPVAMAQSAGPLSSGNVAARAPSGAAETSDHGSTQAFINQAAYANRAEVAEARYVEAHSKNQATKDFAKKMIDDHSTSLQQLEQVASSGGLVMPNGIDKKDRSSMSKLKKEQGARLDMAYSSDQEKDHKEVIAKFEKAADDPAIAAAVRDYARQAIPTLKEHLRMAQQLVATESKGNHSAG